MIQIDFYSGVADVLAFACRLIETVYAKKERLLVWCADLPQSEALSVRLWSINDIAFIPHCHVDAPIASHTPIWLTYQPPSMINHPILLNLTDITPAYPQCFERIIEIVGQKPAMLASGRERFRTYQGYGFNIDHHGMNHG